MSELVTVTGAGGYVGSILVGRLLRAGYAVRAIDRFFFGMEPLDIYRHHPKLDVRQQDIRQLAPGDLEGSWGVIDLAALSNDPSGDLDPELTFQINQRGRINLARAAKLAGVRRYVMSSSCSVYGAGSEANLTEDSELNPLTAYAKSCAAAEEVVRGLNGPEFTSTALRLSTLFGLSPRMRFDLVVNAMTLDAVSKRVISVSGGQQWRPLVGVTDAARAFIAALESAPGAIGGNVFNIGLSNLQVIDVAAVVRETVPGPVDVVVKAVESDARNYSVSFERAAASIGFTAKQTLRDSILEIAAALQEWRVRTDDRTRTVVWYQQLLAKGGAGLTYAAPNQNESGPSITAVNS
ncbi:MAG: SDR family oxidoreductase [Terricaulis sp.]